MHMVGEHDRSTPSPMQVKSHLYTKTNTLAILGYIRSVRITVQFQILLN